MTELTNEAFNATARQIATAVMEVSARRKIADGDLPALAGSAMLIVIGSKLGLLGAVEFLRGTADIVERKIMDDLQNVAGNA